MHTHPTPNINTKFSMNFIIAHITGKMNQDAVIKKMQMSFKEGLHRYGKAP